MSNTITLTVPHTLGVDEAKRRISARLAKLQHDYVNKVGSSDVSWAGDIALVKVSFLAQTATAHVNVQAGSVRVDIELPWVLSALSGKIQQFVTHNANDVLRIGRQ